MQRSPERSSKRPVITPQRSSSSRAGTVNSRAIHHHCRSTSTSCSSSAASAGPHSPQRHSSLSMPAGSNPPRYRRYPPAASITASSSERYHTTVTRLCLPSSTSEPRGGPVRHEQGPPALRLPSASRNGHHASVPAACQRPLPPQSDRPASTAPPWRHNDSCCASSRPCSNMQAEYLTAALSDCGSSASGYTLSRRGSDRVGGRVRAVRANLALRGLSPTRRMA